MNYNNDDIVKAINLYQRSHIDHAIKCWRDETHHMYPRELHGKVYMYCKECKFVRENFLNDYPEIFEYIEKLAA